MKHKWALALLAMAMLTTAASAETVKLTYKDGALNLRSGPGVDYASNGYVHDGDTITVLENGNLWSRVQTADGTKGYIKNQYITGSGVYGDGTEYFGSWYAYASANVNMHSDASTSSTVTAVIAKNTKIEVIGQNGSFYLVRDTAGHQGFVSKTYVGEKSASTETEIYMSVTAESLNVRSGAGSKYPVVDTLTKGTEVRVLTQENGWAQIRFEGAVGWVYEKYLEEVETYKVVTAISLNVRSGAGTGYEIVDTLTYGANVRVLTEENGWSQIRYEGAVGWVSSKYLSDTAEAEVIISTVTKRVSAASLNMRTGAGSKYELMVNIPYGAEVTVLEESTNGWVKINYEGMTGWVSGSYLN